MKSKETGNPVKNRSCLATVRESACRSPFTKGQGNEELSQGAVCISSSKDSRGMGRMRDGKTFSHSVCCAFFINVTFMGRRNAGKKGRGSAMGIFDSAVGYFIRGGLCMWPLLFCSLAVIFLAVERYVYYRG